MVTISFYGAAGEVTGSNFLVETGRTKYVIDCGLFQGQGSFEDNQQELPYHAEEVSAVLVTHAHLDHIGRLPKLVKDGYRGPILATEATIELAVLVLKDAYRVMLSRLPKGQDIKPLYEEVDLRRTISLLKPVKYNETVNLFGKDTARFYDAGHILGSASITLSVGDEDIVFSGDLGHWPNILLPKLETPRSADIVVVEGTYGGVEHNEAPTIERDRLQFMKKSLEWTIQNRGVLLIPAFSIERTEEVLYLINCLVETKQIPKIPVFIDSPLAIETLEVFKRHQDLYRRDIQRELTKDDIFDFHGLALTPTVEDSRDINDLKPPKVIIAGSGMMEGGRIIHHLRRYLPHPNTMVLVVGYQAVGTLGSRILSGAKTVDIFGTPVPVEAKIVKADVFSGHADNSDLIDWLKAIKLKSGSRIVIVHSDPERAENFEKEIKLAIEDTKVIIAEHGQTIEV